MTAVQPLSLSPAARYALTCSCAVLFACLIVWGAGAPMKES